MAAKASSTGRARGNDGGSQLNREEKAAAVAALSERLSAEDTILAADFRGLSVREMEAFRARLREADATFTVIKNTLARRAATDAGREALLPLLDGPCGLLWVGGDPATAARALKEFGDGHNGKPAPKGGLLEGEQLTVEAILQLASLPPRDQLLGQLAGGIAGPLTGLAGGLNNLLAGLARTLAAVQATRADEDAAPASA